MAWAKRKSGKFQRYSFNCSPQSMSVFHHIGSNYIKKYQAISLSTQKTF